MTWTVGDLAGRLRSLADQVAAFPAEDRAPRPLVDPLGDIEQWAKKHMQPELHARSCIDRIEAQAKSNEETFQSMIDGEDDYAPDDGEDKDDARYQAFSESPLSVTRKGSVIDVMESWGGPSDGYEVTMDGYLIERVRYYFRDWFDGAWLEIDQRDYPATFRYLEYITQDVSEDEE